MPQAKERTANIDNPDGNTNSFLEGGAGHKTAVTRGISEIKKLPLVQPEEQGKSRGKVASGEYGEDVDKVGWGITTITNAEHDPEERRKVYSDPKSNPQHHSACDPTA